jgi:hypothetical protein
MSAANLNPVSAPSSEEMDRTEQFNWPVCNAAEDLLRHHIHQFFEANDFARHLAERMRFETGSDFFEWIDHMVLGAAAEAALVQNGFVEQRASDTPDGERVFEHPRATFPSVLIRAPNQNGPDRFVIRVESLGDFIACHGLSSEPQGEVNSRYRYLRVFVENKTEFGATERRAYRGFVPQSLESIERENVEKARQLWRERPRVFDDEAEGFRKANQLLEEVSRLVGPDQVCHYFFEAERAYWESKNRAAQFQKGRQDQLGLGWANHDHHTFRCSRRHFVDLISFLMKIGFQKRERYYAGAQAGWGAQILEQPVAGIVVFADVDLLPEETQIDFSTSRLPPAPRLATVGLWVELHGESFLEAGMHHLEARFDFALMERQLRDGGFKTMKPFSDFEFLRQEFTEGEHWTVRPERASRIFSQGLITREQFDAFVKDGAVGSHLENLQRHGGFKGFNQRSVSAIIDATDPRKQPAKQEAAA